MWTTELLAIYDRQQDLGYESIFKLSPYYNNERGMRRSNLLFKCTDHEAEVLRTFNHPLHMYGGTINQHAQLQNNRFCINQHCVLDRGLYASYVLDIVIKYPNKTILLAGDKNIRDDILRIYKLLPMFLKPGIIICNNENIKFDNDSQFVFRPYSDTLCKGLDINSLLMLNFETNRYFKRLNNEIYPMFINKNDHCQIILHSDTEIDKSMYDYKAFTNLIY